MTSIKAHQHLLIFLLISLAMACVIAPWLAIGADRVAAAWPQLLDERVPFGRVFNRSFMLAAIVLFFFMRRKLVTRETIKQTLGLPARSAWRNFLTGLGLAIGSMVLLAGLMTVADVFTPYFRLSLNRSLGRLSSAILSGITVGFLEEFFFRGILFLGVLQTGARWKAYLFVNLFYSAIHFVKPGEDYFMDELAVLAGFRHLLITFEPFLDLPTLLPGLLGLFLVGLVLSYALERTGNLYLSIGLHSGWIISLKSVRVFGNFVRQDLGWEFGATDPKIVSGVATWLTLALLAVVIARLTRPKAPLSDDRPLSKAASPWPRYAPRSDDTRQNWDG